MATEKTQASNYSAAEAFCAALARHGVTVAFGQSIPSAIHLVAPQFGIRQVAYRTENAGAAMADGYARVSGRVGVVTAQNGPAATLLVPGLAEALKASVPLLALVQDVPRGLQDRNAFQELDHFQLFRGVAKWIGRVETVERIEDYVDMAFTAAASGRPGPAVLLCPLDLTLAKEASAGARRASLGECPLDRVAPDPARVAEAATLLCEAKRPLVFTGGGVHSSKAQAALAALQEEAHLPVATTTMGKGAVDERHPLSVGVIGYFMGTGSATKFMRPLVEEADVILLVGNRANQTGTDSWKLLPKSARIIHCDIDGLEVGRNYEAVRLVGDARLALQTLLAAMQAHGLKTRRGARKGLEAFIAEARRKHATEARPLLRSTAKPVRPERVMAEMEKRLEADDIVVADASYASIWTINYLTSRRAGQRFLTPRGIAGLGWGLPLAIGARLAEARGTVHCVAGDGGFGHVWSELETLKRNGLRVVVTLLNNQVLGYQKDWEDLLLGGHTNAVDFAPVDHAAIARACGVSGVRVTEPEAYGAALDAALKAEGPSLIEVISDPEARPPLNLYEGKFPQTARSKKRR